MPALNFTHKNSILQQHHKTQTHKYCPHRRRQHHWSKRFCRQPTAETSTIADCRRFFHRQRCCSCQRCCRSQTGDNASTADAATAANVAAANTPLTPIKQPTTPPQLQFSIYTNKTKTQHLMPSNQHLLLTPCLNQTRRENRYWYQPDVQTPLLLHRLLSQKIVLHKEAHNEYHGEYNVIRSDQKPDAEHEIKCFCIQHTF